MNPHQLSLKQQHSCIQLGHLENALEKVKSKLEEGNHSIDKLLKYHPNSPRLRYAKARALDLLSEKHNSNKFLEEAIAEYKTVLANPQTPDALFLLAGQKLVERASFRGWMQSAVSAGEQLAQRFPTDTKLLNELGITFLIMGRNRDAKTVFQNVLAKDPDNGVASVHLGFMLKTVDGDLEGAVEHLSKGMASNAKGTDDARFFFQLGDALHRLGRKKSAYEVYDEAVEKGLFLSRYQRSLYNVDELTAQPWWSPEETPYDRELRNIEKEWKTIRDEGLALLDETGVFKLEDENLTKEGDWRQFTLYQRGQKIEKACAQAPKTCEIVSKFPEATGCTRGQIKFSVLHPGTHVWPHCGPTNCRLRAHLGLKTPLEPKIRVGSETKSWKAGKWLIFDDSFEHEVFYESGKGPRLILIVDFWHPDLSEEQRAKLSPI